MARDLRQALEKQGLGPTIYQGDVGRFETETLSTKCKLTALMNLSGQWIDQVHQRQPLKH